MEGPRIHAWLLVASNFDTFDHLLSLSQTCRSLRNALLKDEVLGRLCKTMLPQLVYDSVFNMRPQGSLCYDRMRAFWRERMLPYVRGKKIDDMGFKWEHRVFQHFRWTNPNGTLACWNEQLYMGLDHAQPEERECGDAGAIICGVVKFETAETKGLLGLGKARLQVHPRSFKYFALQGVSQVVAELKIDTQYKYFLYTATVDALHWRWIVVKIVARRDRTYHYVWKAENLKLHMLGEEDAQKVTIQPWGVLPQLNSPGRGVIVGDYFIGSECDFSYELNTRTKTAELPVVRTSSGADLVTRDEDCFWRISSSAVQLLDGKTLQVVKQYPNVAFNPSPYCGFPQESVSPDVIWMDATHELRLQCDSWNKKPWGMYVVDRTSKKEVKIHSLLPKGKNVYITVSAAFGWFFMVDINKNVCTVTRWVLRDT